MASDSLVPLDPFRVRHPRRSLAGNEAANPVTATCELCWVEFPTREELAKHAQIEESVDWPIETEEPLDG